MASNGYIVKVVNFMDVHKSNRYNPFHYFHKEMDVFVFVDALITNTNAGKTGLEYLYWNGVEKLLITAISLYIWHVFPKEKQSFDQLMHLLSMAEVDENDPDQTSQLDILFEDLKNDDPENLAVKYYERFKTEAGKSKTLKSILISVSVRLQDFSLSDIIYLTSEDNLELDRYSDTKKALFIIKPAGSLKGSAADLITSLLRHQIFSF